MSRQIPEAVRSHFPTPESLADLKSLRWFSCSPSSSCAHPAAEQAFAHSLFSFRHSFLPDDSFSFYLHEIPRCRVTFPVIIPCLAIQTMTMHNTMPCS